MAIRRAKTSEEDKEKSEEGGSQVDDRGRFAVVDRRKDVIVSLHDDEKKAQNAAWVNSERYMIILQPYHVTIGQRPDRSVKLNIDPDRCWDDIAQTGRASEG